jgi:Spy/CpxP family protein refolding chaperone
VRSPIAFDRVFLREITVTHWKGSMAALAAAFLLLQASPAPINAQRPPQETPVPYGLHGPEPMNVARRINVHKELQLSKEQVARIKQLAKEGDDKRMKIYSEFAQLPAAERQQKVHLAYRRVHEEANRGIIAVLTPDQAKRLRQIVIQSNPLSNFFDFDVKERLKLTKEQSAKIKAIDEDFAKRVTEIYEGPSAKAGKSSPSFDLWATMRQEAIDKSLGILTDEQKKAWTELIGAPFDAYPENKPKR